MKKIWSLALYTPLVLGLATLEYICSPEKEPLTMLNEAIIACFSEISPSGFMYL